MRNTPVDVACCIAYHQPRHHNPYGVDKPEVEVEVQWFRSGVYKTCKHHVQSCIISDLADCTVKEEEV